MNKCEFIKAFAANVDISQRDATVVYDAFIGTITDALKKGEKVQLTGFATFEIKEKPAREGINPKTKEAINIAASKTPVVKFGNTYKAQF